MDFLQNEIKSISSSSVEYGGDADLFETKPFIAPPAAA